MNDEFLLYGGLALAAVSVIAGAIMFLVFKIKQITLGQKLDEEFGKPDARTARKGK